MEAAQKIAVKNITDQKTTKSDAPKIPKLKERQTEELVFAFVGPVGSGCSTGAEILAQKLAADYDYEVKRYKVSDFIASSAELVDMKIPKDVEPTKRIIELQKIGDKLRSDFGNSYLAGKVIEEIAKSRSEEGVGQSLGGRDVPKKLRRAHIIDSLKNPEELDLLKATYGDIFWLFGIFAPFDVREFRLAHQLHIDKSEIHRIAQTDYKEQQEHGQNVRDVFHQSDFFIRNDKENTKELDHALDRFLGVLFSSPVHTPTIHESAMYAAYAEATKSACLSRQVGAAITNSEGEVLSVGRNDVPKSGGGLYREDDGERDHRCHSWQGKVCHNDHKKSKLYEQIFSALKEADLLSSEAARSQVERAIQMTDVKALIEYSRAVHAEMDAIISVARTNRPGLQGGILYSTTFPCHSCARHIVASGISTVFFIEPYPKSLATELHSDAITENETNGSDRVVFLQYTGIAPKNILKLFSTKTKRKENGALKNFAKDKAAPIVTVSLDDYSTHEKWVIAELADNEKKSKNKQATLPDI